MRGSDLRASMPVKRMLFAALTTPAFWGRVILAALFWDVALLLAAPAEVPSPNTPPSIFWLSQPVSPGDVISVYGHGLENLRTATVQRLEDDPSSEQANGPEIIVQAEKVTNESLLLRLPASLAPGSYALKGQADNNPVALINVPKVHWIQGDLGQTAHVGGWVRILGNSISMREGALARLKSADGRLRVFKLMDASKWSARLDLPQDVAPGTYEIDVWNGYGNARGWTPGGTLVIERNAPAPVRVREFGPDELNGAANLQRVLNDVANEGGGAVRLRAGVYYFDAPLHIPPGVALQGAGKNLTSLVWTKTGSSDDLVVGETKFTLSDFALFAGEHGHIISGGFSGAAEEARDISIVNVIVRASAYRGHLSTSQVKDRLDAQLSFSTGGADSIRLSGRNLKIIGCEIYGSGRSLFLLNPRFALIRGNVFSNGRWGWYSLSGSDGVIFEDNMVQGADLMSTGGGANTLDSQAIASRNVAFLRNTFSGLNGWDREAFTSDGSGGVYSGPIVGATARSIVVPLETSIGAVHPGLDVFLLGGRGRGQMSRITRVLGSEIEIETEWKVIPDVSSFVVITKIQENYIIADNMFIDTGVAVQFYGTAVNHVVAGNRAIRTAGFLTYALNYRGFQPSWYVQFLENILDSSIAYAMNSKNELEWRSAWMGLWAVHAGPSGSPMALAPIFRKNVLDRNARIVIRRPSNQRGAVEGAVIQSNVFLGRIDMETAETVNSLTVENHSIGDAEPGRR